MGALETNTTLIYGVHIRESANDGSDFSNGATDYRVLFLGEDGQLHVKDSAGAVTEIGAAGGPGAELDYVQITATSNLTATTEGTANTIITGTSQTYAAVPTLIEFFSPQCEPHGSAGAANIILLYDGATVLGRLGVLINNATGTMRTPLHLSYRLTPTAATHQYIIKGYKSGSGGTPYIGAGAGGTGVELPAFLRITRV